MRWGLRMECRMQIAAGLADKHPSIFGIRVDFSSALTGGFSFHPTDKGLSAGSPAEEKAN